MIELITEKEDFDNCFETLKDIFPKSWDFKREELEHEEYKSFMIKENGKAIYYAIRQVSKINRAYDVYLCFSWVEESHRNKGIATQAILDCIDWFKKKYIECYFRVSCRIDNPQSLKTFKKTKFSICDTFLGCNGLYVELNRDDTNVENIGSCEQCESGLRALYFVYRNLYPVGSFNEFRDKVAYIPGVSMDYNTMINNCINLFEEPVVYNNNVYSNAFILNEMKSTQNEFRKFYIVKTDEGWIVVFDYVNNFYRYYDTTDGFNSIVKQCLLQKSISNSLLTILIS